MRSTLQRRAQTLPSASSSHPGASAPFSAAQHSSSQIIFLCRELHAQQHPVPRPLPLVTQEKP